ncbi:protein PGR-like [Phoenix dactylifera]|uniref:Protein PGR-like n=1 Tax=Phoenix dactylifera TaxID=42345 RepID=A0A8B7D208_PHODC|nr:protein PGR-like [Phoenix dactylifera]
MMEGFLIRSVVSVVLSLLIAARAYKRRSLDGSGALAGFLVMVIHIAADYRFGALLLVFFFTSSKLTRIGEEKKRAIEEDFKEGGLRNWVQVLANSAIATILVVLVAKRTGGKDRCLDTRESALITGLIGGIIGHYACCNGDTWSSEIGMLSNAQPRLITTFKTVRKGTNGGVTVEGLLAAAAAGFVIGLAYVIVGLLTVECAHDVIWRQLLVIPVAAAAGLCGSLIDSLLGATLQFSGYCTLRKRVVGKRAPTVVKISGMSILDNNAVNAVSVLSTALLTSVACLYIF